MEFSTRMIWEKMWNTIEWGFPGGSDGKESIHLQCERPGFEPWVGKIPWGRAWQPTLVFLPGEFPRTEEPGGLQSIV